MHTQENSVIDGPFIPYKVLLKEGVVKEMSRGRNATCPRCGCRPKAANLNYCRECSRERAREWDQQHRSRRRDKREASHKVREQQFEQLVAWCQEEQIEALSKKLSMRQERCFVCATPLFIVSDKVNGSQPCCRVHGNKEQQAALLQKRVVQLEATETALRDVLAAINGMLNFPIFSDCNRTDKCFTLQRIREFIESVRNKKDI